MRSAPASKACTKCGIEKPIDDFPPRGDRPWRSSWCRKCCNAKTRRTYRIVDRWVILQRRYGLSREDFDAMMAQQGGACAICKKPMEVADVDHDHQTGVVRGLLCRRCNIWLAPLEDREYRAAALAYLGEVSR